MKRSKKLRRRNRRKTKKVRGSGNFINPKSNRECYSNLLDDVDVKKQFDNGTIQDTELFNNIIIENSLAKGGFNAVNLAIGKNICMASDRTMKKHPLLFRYSKNPINKFNKKDHEYYKEKYGENTYWYRRALEKYINDSIKSYEEDMKLQVQLSKEGMMPFIYMCGTFFNSGFAKLDTNIEPGYIHTFTIMEKFGDNLHSIFEKPDIYEHIWKELILSALGLYEKLAKRGICNLDVKPGNVVVSFTDSGEIDRVALIDIDQYYNMDENDMTVSADMMKLMFLLFLKKWFYGQVVILNTIEEEIGKISIHSFHIANDYINDTESIMYDSFENYGLLELFQMYYIKINKRYQQEERVSTPLRKTRVKRDESQESMVPVTPKPNPESGQTISSKTNLSGTPSTILDSNRPPNPYKTPSAKKNTFDLFNSVGSIESTPSTVVETPSTIVATPSTIFASDR